jgi:hypothetical protein
MVHPLIDSRLRVNQPAQVTQNSRQAPISAADNLADVDGARTTSFSAACALAPISSAKEMTDVIEALSNFMPFF